VTRWPHAIWLVVAALGPAVVVEPATAQVPCARGTRWVRLDGAMVCAPLAQCPPGAPSHADHQALSDACFVELPPTCRGPEPSDYGAPTVLHVDYCAGDELAEGCRERNGTRDVCATKLNPLVHCARVTLTEAPRCAGDDVLIERPRADVCARNLSTPACVSGHALRVVAGADVCAPARP